MDAALVPALFDVLMVLQTGSVSEAARRLGKTPSAVSQQIRHFTDITGVPLLERRGRKLVASPAAREALPSITRLFDEVENVGRALAELSGSAPSVLRIAASDYLGPALLVPVLRDVYRHKTPIRFEVSTANSYEAQLRLQRGDVEMAIATHPGGRSEYEESVLFEQPFYWVGTKRRGDPPFEDRLTEEPLIRLAEGSLGRTLLDRYVDQHALRPVSTIDIPSVSIALAYATGGVGVALLPALPLTTPEARGLSLQRADMPALPVKLLRRTVRSSSSAVKIFVTRLLEEAAAQRIKIERLPRDTSA